MEGEENSQVTVIDANQQQSALDTEAPELPVESSPPKQTFNNLTDLLNSNTKQNKEQKSAEPILQATLNRRKFLQVAATTGAALAVAYTTRSASNMIPQEGLVNPEGLKYINNTVFLDFAPETPIQGIQQSSYPNNGEIERKLLGNNYKNVFQRLWLGLTSSKNEILKRDPLFGLLHGGLQQFSKHGEIVTTVHRKALAEFGFDSTPTIIPLQSGLTTTSDLNYEDNLGNKGITIELAVDPIIEQLKKTPQTIVSMSFQCGKMKIVYKEKDITYEYDSSRNAQLLDAWDNYYPVVKDRHGGDRYYVFDDTNYYVKYDNDHGKKVYRFIDKNTGQTKESGYKEISKEEYTALKTAKKKEFCKESLLKKEVKSSDSDTDSNIEIQGAYSGKDGEENIQQLFKLVNSFNDKLFIVAAGNYNDDLRPLREKFKDKWPKNLLIVGQWNSDKNKPEAVVGETHGADIYIDNKDLGYENDRKFSSIPTTYLSAIANILAAKNYDIYQIKEKLLKLTITKDYITGYQDSEALESVDIDKMVEAIVNPQKATARVFNFPQLQQEELKVA